MSLRNTSRGRAIIDYYYRSGGGGAGSITEPTEAELLSYIMANFPPSFFLDPEQGLVDSSGNDITITSVGTPDIVSSGYQNDRGYVNLVAGDSEGLLIPRVDIGTLAIGFRDLSGTNGVFRVPQNDASTTAVQGIIYTSSRYEFRPDSGGSITRSISELTYDNTQYRNLVCSGASFVLNNGQSAFRVTASASADSSASNMTVGYAATGAGGSATQYNSMHLGYLMIWSTPLTSDQLYILNAYLEKRTAAYGKITYQYRAGDITLEATNPVIDSNSFSEDTQNQTYPPSIIKDGSNWICVYKGFNKRIFGSNSTTDLLTWTDQDEIIPNGSFGQFDVNGINNCLIIKKGSTYTLIYNGRNASSEYQIGIATSSSPYTGYTKDESNPVLTLSDINTPLSKSYDELYPVDYFEEDGTVCVILIGAVNSSDSDIIKVSGADLNNLGSPEILLTIADSPLKPYVSGAGTVRDSTGLPYYCRWIEFGGVHDYLNVQVGFLVAGQAAEQKTENRTKLIWPCVKVDGTWKVVAEPIVNTVNSEWNSNASYFPTVIREQSGNYTTPVDYNGTKVLAFTGRTLDSESQQYGVIGLAYAADGFIKELL